MIVEGYTIDAYCEFPDCYRGVPEGVGSVDGFQDFPGDSKRQAWMRFRAAGWTKKHGIVYCRKHSQVEKEGQA
jgi:hypothetical protein